MKNRLLFTSTILVLATSCNMLGKMNEMMDATESTQRNCACDMVEPLGYNIHNGTSSAGYRLVGCEYESLDSMSTSIVTLIQDSFPEFCEVDNFSLIFVNKGTTTVKEYSNCEPVTE